MSQKSLVRQLCRTGGHHDHHLEYCAPLWLLMRSMKMFPVRRMALTNRATPKALFMNDNIVSKMELVM
jgi:hypothetical protein